MLIFVGIYLVLSCTLGVILGRMIKYGTSASVCDSNQAGLANTRIFSRGSESNLGSQFQAVKSQ